jgi:potassium efflux system protein
MVVIWGLGSGLLDVIDELTIMSFSMSDGLVEKVSLADLLGGLLVLFSTFWIVRNLRSLFDAFVFPHFRLDPGARYAMLTITRWTLFVTGLLIALSAVHLSLGRIGWLMAAMGVGIGFGLQEIVANMVSGVILLIERPIRVGDVLSVGDTSGEVRRINIRATTILNLDRQEVIVPNKDFITKEVTNWTLADKVLRLIIDIGVAYGSDVDRVRQLLLDIARENPLVRKKPEPAAYFVNHGDSSLDFRLYAFITDPRIRFRVTDEINSQINKRLAKENIEIPFPQRDLHIRSDHTKT